MQSFSVLKLVVHRVTTALWRDSDDDNNNNNDTAVVTRVDQSV
jgi:hypothetical protein